MMGGCKWCMVVMACVATAAAIQGCDELMDHRATGVLRQTQPHVAGTAVQVEARHGSVTIAADPQRQDVDIEAQITCGGDTQAQADQRLAETTLHVERQANQSLLIKPVFAGAARSGDAASFTIKLPEAVGVSIKTSNGAVTIAGLEGEAALTTSNARVQVDRHDGPVTVNTSNGPVKVMHVKGPAKITSSNGWVEASDIAGELSAATSNASIKASEIAGPAQATSSNGSITLALAPEQAGPVIVRTSNSSIKVTVGPAFVGPVKLGTSNSAVTVNDPGNRVSNRSLKKSGGNIVVGTGGAESSITTSNGSIKLTISDGSAAAAAASSDKGD